MKWIYIMQEPLSNVLVLNNVLVLSNLCEYQHVQKLDSLGYIFVADIMGLHVQNYKIWCNLIKTCVCVCVCVSVCDGCGIIGHIKSLCPAVLVNTQGLQRVLSSLDVYVAWILASVLVLCQCYILDAAKLTILMIQLIIIKSLTVNNILIIKF